MPPALSNVKAGRLRALGVTTAKRSAAAPDIPTIGEAGLPGYESDNWYGLLAPAGVPRDIIQLISAEAVKALQSPELRERLAGQGVDAVGNTPEQFLNYVKSETAKWNKVIQEARIRAD
jgi:tripartite-type tricarboxylate transporter receptor subunit TctC